MSEQDDTENRYEVGYGRPPQHSRFQPGQSGNPRGRAKGTRGLRTDLHAELISRMTIQINGKPVTATKQQLMVKTLTARAAAGDVRAISKLIDLVLQVFGTEDRGGDKVRLSPNDQGFIDRMLSRLGETSEQPAPEPGEGSDHADPC